MLHRMIDKDRLIECLHEKFHAYELDEGISKGIDIAMGVVNEQPTVYTRESEKDARIAELDKALDRACEVILRLRNRSCDNCVFNENYECQKGFYELPLATFSPGCRRAEWWKETLLKEASE